MRKFLSFATAAVLLITMIPHTILADTPHVSLDEETGVLTLSGAVEVDEVRAYVNDTRVKTVVAEEGTVFPRNCSYMFAGIQAKTIDLSNVSTAGVTDMGGMFGTCMVALPEDEYQYGCTIVTGESVSCYNLETIIFGELWDTSEVTDMSRMFEECRNLKRLDLSGFQTSKVTDMSWMFQCCNELVALNISHFDTSSVSTMRFMFSSCCALTELNLSFFNTSNVTTMGEMFSGCYSLTKLDVSGWDTSHVRDMSKMFNYCTKLRTLDVSGFDTSNVQYMDHMFADCESLTVLDVSQWNVSQLKSAYYMFEGCRSLQSIDLTNWDVSSLELGKYNRQMGDDVTEKIIKYPIQYYSTYYMTPTPRAGATTPASSSSSDSSRASKILPISIGVVAGAGVFLAVVLVVKRRKKHSA